jgi:hypothetical protein
VYLEKNGESQTEITHSIIKKFLKDQFYFLNFKLLPLYNEQEDDENGNEEFYLFIWCILTDRLDIARIFWRLGKVWLHP